LEAQKNISILSQPLLIRDYRRFSFYSYSNCTLKVPEQGENTGENKVIPASVKKSLEIFYGFSLPLYPDID